MKSIRDNRRKRAFSSFLSRGKLLLIIVFVVISYGVTFGLNEPLKVIFEGVRSEHKWVLKDLDSSMPSDWSDYNYLVIEMKQSTPQRFSLWIYTSGGNRRLMLQPFGQNVWLRASIPLQYFKGKDQRGNDLASANNRRTDSFWMSLWGPFGELKDIEALGVVMDYPLEKPVLEIRSLELSKEDAGSEFLEDEPVTDEFGQWVHADWPRKIKSREQLKNELSEEEKNLSSDNFNLSKYGGYKDAKVEGTGFFRVEKIDGRWWFVDPEGYLFLSTGSNGMRPGFGGGGGRRRSDRGSADSDNDLLRKRMESWGLNTIGNWSSARGPTVEKAYVVTFRGPRLQISNLGMPDVYSEDFVAQVDASARQQCLSLRDDPFVLGYFIGNEPPWPGRESELVDMFLNGQECETKTRLQEYLAQGDTKERRIQFVYDMFEKYLTTMNDAIKKYDPNHLNLGIRYGGSVPEAVLEMAKMFDVCSINVYEYEPTRQIERACRISGRPVIIGEFHFGTPRYGLGAGLVQVIDLKERGVGYRYYMEQSAKLEGFVGAHWFTWTDEPVLGRFDGENYNIGILDTTGRAYSELVKAMIETHKRLYNVHSGKIEPFNQRPRASEAGTPNSPWD